MSMYDYIVVGSGSAGAVVAGRLSEDPNVKVLLIESGASSRPLNVRIPAAFATQFKSKLDWEFYTEPEEYLCGRVLYQPRAKNVGGGSTMNAMIYMRGSRHDYSAWAQGGATGWSYDEVLPLFKKSEANSRGADEFHGDSGPMHIQDLQQPNPMTATLIDALVATGMPYNPDFNGAEQVGAGPIQSTTKSGVR